MSKKQEFARRRNWRKGKIITARGMLLEMKYWLCEDECKKVTHCIDILDEVIKNWDENYKKASRLNAKRHIAEEVEKDAQPLFI